MSTELNANVLMLPERERNFRRPHMLGLLPGRVFAGVGSDPRTGAAALGLTASAFDRPSATARGRWYLDAEAGAAHWLGRRTDAHPNVQHLPDTYLPLGETVARLAAQDLLLTSGALLSDAGWGAELLPRDCVRALYRHSTNFSGISGIFDLDGPGERWQVELYTNGMVFADTQERLDTILQLASQLVRLNADEAA